MKIFILLVLLGLALAYDRRGYHKGYPRRRRHKRHCPKYKLKCKKWIKKFKCKKCFKYKKFWRRKRIWFKVPKYVKKCKIVGRRKRKCRGRFKVCKPKVFCKRFPIADTLIKKKCRRRWRKACWRGRPHFVCKKRWIRRKVGEKKICRHKRPFHGAKKPSGNDYRPKYHGYYGHGKKKFHHYKKRCFFKPIFRRIPIKKCKRIRGIVRCKRVPGKLKCWKVVKRINRRFKKKCFIKRKCHFGKMKKCCKTKGFLKCKYFKRFIKKWKWIKVRPYWKKIYSGKLKCKFAGIKPLGWKTKHFKKCHKKKYYGHKYPKFHGVKK